MALDRAISLATLTVLDLSPPEMVMVAARCGYSHVGLRPIAATCTEKHFSILDDADMRRETLAALRDTGIGVLDIEILRLKPETVVADFEPVLEFGAEFGAQFALLAGNDPNLSRTADNFSALCDLAFQFGIRPHIEFMPWTEVPNIATALRITGNTDNGGVLVDGFHLNRSGGTIHAIPVNDPRFGYVQLCDIAGPIPAMDLILDEARSNRLFPGEGDIDLCGLLQRLPHIPVSIEVPADRLRETGWTADACAKYAYDTTVALLNHADANAGV